MFSATKKPVYIVMLLTVLMAIGLFLLSGCKNDNSPIQTTSVKVGVLQIGDSLPIYVAQSEEYFKAEGIDVTILPFKSSSEESQALAAGSIDFAMNDMVVQSLLLKSNTAVQTVALAQGATPKEGRFAIIAAPGKNIRTPEDLIGKKIAISKNTMMEYLVDSYLEEFHITSSQVNYVNMPNLLLRMETLLNSNEIDAAILPDPLATVAIEKGGTLIIDDTLLPVNLSQSVILGNTKWMNEHPTETKKFLAAYNNAIANINNNPQKYKAMLVKLARIPAPIAEQYPMPTFTQHALPTPQEVAILQLWLVKKQLIPHPFTYKEIVYHAE